MPRVEQLPQRVRWRRMSTRSIVEAELARALLRGAAPSTSARPLRQPAAQRLAHRLAVAAVARRAPAGPLPRRVQPRPSGPSGEMNPPGLIARRQARSAAAGNGSGGHRTAPRLLALALDPGAMPLDEALDRARRRFAKAPRLPRDRCETRAPSDDARAGSRARPTLRRRPCRTTTATGTSPYLEITSR